MHPLETGDSHKMWTENRGQVNGLCTKCLFWTGALGVLMEVFRPFIFFFRFFDTGI